MKESRVKVYYTLAKPGIIYGNALTAVAGFFFAAQGNVVTFLEMLFGISLVMASACVCNNYLDRDIDALMKRTQQRPSVKGTISLGNGLLYALILGVIGFGLLLATNPLTAFIGFIGFFVYVWVYGYAKRVSVHGTLVGSIAGAVPPVVGYTAVTNRFDIGAFILFLILVLWQMPHSYAISIFRKEDYAAANIPVLAVAKGERRTKWEIVIYSALFLGSVVSLTVFGYSGYTFAVVVGLLSLWWLWHAMRGFSANSTKVWARLFFRYSLFVMIGLSLMLSLDSLLP